MRLFVILFTLIALWPAGARAGEGAAATPAPHGPIIPRVEPLAPRPFTLEDRYLDAARRGDLPVLQTCLDKGVAPKAKDAFGRSAFLLSVRDARDLEMAKYLQARGLATDDPDASGRTPLSYAAGNGDLALVSYLLEQGASPDHRDAQGQSPLFNAVLAGSKPVVERLLAANAAVNVQDRFGDTPLIGACNKGFDGIAQLLVEKGADPSLKDQEGLTAAQRADESSDYCRTLGGKAGAAASAPAAERDAPRANGSAD